MVCIEMLLKMMRRWLAKWRVNLRQWLDGQLETAIFMAIRYMIFMFLCEP